MAKSLVGCAPSAILSRGSEDDASGATCRLSVALYIKLWEAHGCHKVTHDRSASLCQKCLVPIEGKGSCRGASLGSTRRASLSDFMRFMHRTFVDDNGRRSCLFWQQKSRQANSLCNLRDIPRNGLAPIGSGRHPLPNSIAGLSPGILEL